MKDETINNYELISGSGSFTENKGQWDSDIRFVGETSFGRIGLTKSGIYYEIALNQGQMDTDRKIVLDNKLDETLENSIKRTQVLKYEFIDPNFIDPVGDLELSQTSNYFLGNDPDRWVTEVKNFANVIYQDVWPGIDLKYYFSKQGLKYDLILHPGSNPDQIRLKVLGHDKISMNEDLQIWIGDKIALSDGYLSIFYEDEPLAQIDGQFIIDDRDQISFNLGDHDRSRTIIIDPLVYSAHIGGTYNDYCYDVISDSAGNAYITGSTWSNNFPSTTGSHSTSYVGDVFLTKLSPAGDSIVFSTFIGGSSWDYGFGIGLDHAKNIYITGKTDSTSFPVTEGCFQENKRFDADVFVVKLNPRGDRILYGTFVGGIYKEQGLDIAVEPDGEVFVTGFSERSDFPTTDGSFMETHAKDNYPYYDAFIFKLNSQGTDLIYSTLLGGDGTDVGFSIDTDGKGNAIVAGWDYSRNFPQANGTPFASNTKASSFLVKINESGTGLLFSTVFGGSGSDMARDVDVGPSGNLIVTGRTNSENYPVTEGAFDQDFNGDYDMFITVFNPDASEMLYSTYFGGNESDGVYHSTEYGYKQRVKTDQNGNIYVTGETYSTDLPVTDNGFMTEHQGDRDVFVAVLDPSLSHLYYSSFLGSERRDYGSAMDIDNLDRPILAGTMDSENFPYKSGSFKADHAGADRAFVTKFGMEARPSKPTGLSAILSVEYITLSWTLKPGDNMGYHIYRSEDGGPYAYHTTVGNVNTYVDSGYNRSITYSYKITAYNQYRDSLKTDAVTATDNVAPEFIEDLTGQNATTGDVFDLSVRVRDNIFVENVELEYWVNIDSHITVDLIRADEDLWNGSIIIGDKVGFLNYVFRALDSIGNSRLSEERAIPIIDNDKPQILSHAVSKNATTGDAVVFSVEVYDNIKISRLYLEYILWSGTIMNTSFNDVSNPTLSIILPNNFTGQMQYRFLAVDVSGNWNHSRWEELSISDDEPPWIERMITPPAANTGDALIIKADIRDNIEVGVVSIHYHFGTKPDTTAEMILDNGFFTYEIVVPMNSLSYLHFSIEAIDTNGLKTESTEQVLTVIDSISPVVENISDITYYQGQLIEIKCFGSDNIGIETIEWIDSPLLVTGDTLKGVIDQVGTFQIKVVMYDREGNSNFTEFNLTILDEFNDMDGDGLWDLKELELGLDPENEDTDGDGMPDGWELNHGLNPSIPSADNDQDQDGLSDLEEFLRGSDPLVPEKEEDSIPFIVIIISVLAVMVLVIAALIVLFIVIRSKRAKAEDEDASSEVSDILANKEDELETLLNKVDSMERSGIDPNIPVQTSPNEEGYSMEQNNL